MFGLGFGEILLLMAIGLIVLGPKQMPQVARVIGRTLAELKKALSDVTSAVAVDFKDEDKKDEKAKADKDYVPHKPFVLKEEGEKPSPEKTSSSTVSPDKKETS